MSTTYLNSQSNTGICTLTVLASVGVTWNLTSLEVSQAGPTVGPNAKLTIYDGPIGGTVLFADYLSAPGIPGSAAGLGGSVGICQKINLPTDALGRTGVQALTGNAI